MKMIITGATGFVGGHLFRHNARLGHEVLGIGRTPHPSADLLSYGKYISKDLCSPFKTMEADCVIHCAGYASDRGNWNTFYENNVLATRHAFNCTSSPIFINISSSSIYPFSSTSISEKQVDKSNFPSLYGKSKWLAEEYIRMSQQNKRTVISLRPRAIYGRHDRVLLPRILALGKSGRISLPGDGRIEISMTHIDNLISAVDLAIEKRTSGYSAFNVADDQTYLLRNVIYSILSNFHQKNLPIRELPKRLVRSLLGICSILNINLPLTQQSFDYITRSCVLNISKIKNELGYCSKTNFQLALPQIIHWAKANF